jgi:hypothetical protein
MLGISFLPFLRVYFLPTRSNLLLDKALFNGDLLSFCPGSFRAVPSISHSFLLLTFMRSIFVLPTMAFDLSDSAGVPVLAVFLSCWLAGRVSAL